LIKKDHILFIGMGDLNTPQLKIAKKHGLKTIATNRDPKSRALSECDIPIVIDGRNALGILTFLYTNKLDDRVLTVYTGTELFLTAALVASALGLKWHSIKASYICEHKVLMKEILQKNRIPTPFSIPVRSSSDVKKVFSGYSGKLILKPADCSSCLGITVVDKTSRIKEAFDLAMEHSRSKQVICEKYIEDATLHDVNGIMDNGKLIRLGLSDKTASELPYAIVIEGRCPSILTPAEQERVYKIFEKACGAAGLTNGPVKGDLIRDKNGDFLVMEVAPRFHGILLSLYIVPIGLNISPFEELMKFFLGRKIKKHRLSYKSPVISRFTAEDNMKKAREHKGLVSILVQNGIYDRKKWKSNYDVPIYVITGGKAR
jgi:biotin carboxylase